MLKKLIIVCLYIINISSPLRADPPETEISGLYRTFLPGYQHLSPLNGLLILRSGILSNIRFHSHYGPRKEGVLCHYQITNPPPGITSTSNRDCPQDFTTSIIQQLFPSPAGGILGLPGPKHDLFKLIPIGQIGALIKIYTEVKKANLEKAEAYAKFQNLFRSWLAPTNDTNSHQVIIKSGDRNNLKKLWTVQKDNGSAPIKDDILRDLSDKYATMFSGALDEQTAYPHNFIESALLALAWKRATTIADLNPLFAALQDYLVLVEPPVSSFSKQSYDDWKTLSLVNNKITREAYLDLVQDPEKLIFTTLAYDIYDNPYPKILGTGTATHTYKGNAQTQHKENFSDCGETTIRNLFNILLSDPKERIFKVDHLQAAFPNIIKSVVRFYEGDREDAKRFKQSTYEEVIGSALDRSAWADAISSLNQESDPLKISNGDTQGRCNIQEGIDNLLSVLEKILKDPEISRIRLPELDQKKRRADILSYILKRFSRPGTIFSWHISNDMSVLENFAEVTLSINGKDQFILKSIPNHFEITPIVTSNMNINWRQNQPELIKWLLESTNKSNNLAAESALLLQGQLLPFYINSQAFPILLQSNYLDKAHTWTYELLYGSQLSGVEQTVAALDLALSVNPKIIDIARNWINKFQPDFVLDRQIISFIHKHKDVFNEHEFTKENYPRLKEIYDQTIISFQGDLNNKQLFNYINPYSEKLLIDIIIDIIKDKSFEVIFDLRSAEYQTLLHIACVQGFKSLINELLNKARGHDIWNINLMDQSGYTPLHSAAYNDQPQVVQLLLSIPEAKQFFLTHGYKYYYSQNSLLETAVEKNQPKIIKVLLNDNEMRGVLLSREIIRNKEGDTPLHTAVKHGFKECVISLLSNLEARQILLNDQNIRDKSGKTPIILAKEAFHPEIISLLNRIKKDHMIG